MTTPWEGRVSITSRMRPGVPVSIVENGSSEILIWRVDFFLCAGLLRRANQNERETQMDNSKNKEPSDGRGDMPQISATLIDLAREENRLTTNLVNLAEKRNELADRRTEAADLRTHLAHERTELVKDQTRLSTESTELAQLRTDLSKKRTDWARERTGMATERTGLAEDRTDMAKQRTGLSEQRTTLAQERNDLATSRSDLSGYRSLLARGRTELAFIRTGLAFVAIGVALVRYFGFGYWTLLDGMLIVVGAIATIFGVTRFAVTRKQQRRFDRKLAHLLTVSPD